MLKAEIYKTILSYSSPFWALKRRISKKKLIIPLIFHDIPIEYREKFKNILLLAKSIHPFLTPHEFEAVKDGKMELGKTSFLLTFDDGFLSNKEVADTILKDLRIRAVFFVCSNFISLEGKEAREFSANRIFEGQRKIEDISIVEKAMSWNDLSSLIAQGHMVGNHGSNHIRLSTLPSSDEYIDEICNSGDLLEKKLNVPVNWFSYPFGNIASINQSALKVIAQRYKYSFSGIRGANELGTNPYALCRESIKYSDTIWLNKLILNGGLSPFYIRARQKLNSHVNVL